MNQQQFESRLAGLREEPLTELPELVQARMNDTYRVIGGMEGTDPKVPETAKTSRIRRKRSWLTRVMISAASVAAGLVLIISLGFVSPAMADALKQLPFLESVFKLAGDAGLKKANETGVTADIQQSVTHGGLTFSVSEQMYDGSRLSLVLTRKQAGKVGEEGPLSDLWTIPDPETGLLNRIDSYVNGAEVITGGRIASGGPDAPDSVIVTVFNNSENQRIPDEFDFKMSFTVPGIRQPFEFEFPVSKNTLRGYILTPKETKIHDHIHLRVKRLEVSETTTLLMAEFKGEQGEDVRAFQEAIPEKYKNNGFLSIFFDVMDEQGREVGVLSVSGGSGEGDTLDSHNVYEPFETIPESIVIKPYVWKDGRKLYIPEFEITVPVK